jgi:hypothetical protein
MGNAYLMQRFDMNGNFPERGPGEIAPYIGESFVLFRENGSQIPLGNKGLGNSRGLSEHTIQRLKTLQDEGCTIRGDVHPLFTKPRIIGGDVEYFEPFPADSANYERLRIKGVDLIYDN